MRRVVPRECLDTDDLRKLYNKVGIDALIEGAILYVLIRGRMRKIKIGYTTHEEWINRMWKVEVMRQSIKQEREEKERKERERRTRTDDEMREKLLEFEKEEKDAYIRRDETGMVISKNRAVLLQWALGLRDNAAW